jgi:regulator of replication initiation timing
MSMIGTLLAFVVFPLKAKPKEPAPPVPKTWEFALEYWRNAYAVLWRENERLRKQLDDVRAESLRLIDERDALRRQLELFNRIERVPSRQDQAMQAQQAQYQGLQQLQQNGPYNKQASAFAQSQQSQQNLGYDCNCVPSRAEAFGRGATRQ